jgi:hypothetical protein
LPLFLFPWPGSTDMQVFWFKCQEYGETSAWDVTHNFFFLNLNQRFNAYLIYNPLALSGILRQQELCYEYGGWNLNYGLWEKLFISIVRTTAQDSGMFAAGKSSRRDGSLILLLILIPRMIYQESESVYALWQMHLHCMRLINMLVFLLQWDELDMKLSGRILLQVFVWCCKLDQSGTLSFPSFFIIPKKRKKEKKRKICNPLLNKLSHQKKKKRKNIKVQCTARI